MKYTRLQALDRLCEEALLKTHWPNGVYNFGGMKPADFSLYNIICTEGVPFDFDKWDIVYRLEVTSDHLEIKRMKP